MSKDDNQKADENNLYRLGAPSRTLNRMDVKKMLVAVKAYRDSIEQHTPNP